MPHYTRSGDDGDTSLYGGGRVPKHHQQPECFGAVDEATSAFGLARALSTANRTKLIIEKIQRGLYRIMAELAMAPDKSIDKKLVTTKEHVEELEAIAEELEREIPSYNQFVLPGEKPDAAALDLARSTIRRAERESSRLKSTGYEINPELLRYLNRTSSVAYDLARYEAQVSGATSTPATENTPDAQPLIDGK